MGDRVHVTLTVLAEQADQAKEILEAGCGEADDECVDAGFVFFAFEEVNYGKLEVEDELTQAAIAWDKEWDAGGGFGAGHEHIRFTEQGEIQRIEIGEGGENPPMHELLARIDQPDELRAFILAHRDETTPLPWDNQVEYGKRYLARELISGPT